jgi:hypothetical protein
LASSGPDPSPATSGDDSAAEAHDSAAADVAKAELEADERAELDRLRAEVSELQQAHTDPPRRRRASWRAPVAAVLIVLGCLLAPISVLGVWTANQVSSTSRYVANIEPLIHDPAIQNALTDKVTTEITSHLNVTGYTNQAAALLTSKGLPRVGSLLQSFAPSISSAVAGFIHSTVRKIVTSPQFARAWVRVNTVAHQQLVTALSGQGGGAIAVSNGQVTIDLAPFITMVKHNLAARGFTLVNSLPPIHPTLALFSSKKLVQAQTAYRLINDLKIVLPILALLLLALGAYVARNHRRAIIGAGLGLAASMLVLGAGLLIFRGIYLNSVPSSVLPSDAAAAMFDTLVRFIKQGLRTILVLGLVVAAGAFITGSSVTAVRSRSAFASGLGWLRESGERAGLRTGPVGRWTYAHRTGLRICAVSLAALILVFSNQPTGLTVILITVLLLVVLGLIELIGRPVSDPKLAGHA